MYATVAQCSVLSFKSKYVLKLLRNEKSIRNSKDVPELFISSTKLIDFSVLLQGFRSCLPQEMRIEFGKFIHPTNALIKYSALANLDSIEVVVALDLEKRPIKQGEKRGCKTNIRSSDNSEALSRDLFKMPRKTAAHVGLIHFILNCVL